MILVLLLGIGYTFAAAGYFHFFTKVEGINMKAFAITNFFICSMGALGFFFHLAGVI